MMEFWFLETAVRAFVIHEPRRDEQATVVDDDDDEGDDDQRTGVFFGRAIKVSNVMRVTRPETADRNCPVGRLYDAAILIKSNIRAR